MWLPCTTVVSTVQQEWGSTIHSWAVPHCTARSTPIAVFLTSLLATYCRRSLRADDEDADASPPRRLARRSGDLAAAQNSMIMIW